MATAPSTCLVCLEDTVEGSSAVIICPLCSAGVHSKCAEDHLLNTVLDPHCPGCLKDWPYDFLSRFLNKGWRLGKYKNYREDVLLDREKSLIPATQEAAALVIKLGKIPPIKKQLQAEVRKISAQISEHKRQIKLLRGGRKATKCETDPEIVTHRVECQRLEADARRLDGILIAIHHNRYDPDTGLITDAPINGAASLVADRREFIRPCPAPDCRGFLSTGWKCKICSAKVCSKCGELKTGEDENHECEPGTLASFQLIRAESRGCPKCGVPITKISGCDHMFCTDCKTAFSWRTGEIHPTGNSNPHYHQWRAQNAREQVPSVTTEQFCANDNRLRISRIVDMLCSPRSLNLPYRHPLAMLISAWRHLEGYELVQIRRPLNRDEFRQLRIEYILGEINETEWKIQIQRIEKKCRKAQFMANILELFIRGSIDILDRPLILHTDIPEIEEQVEQLRILCNGELNRIQQMFGSNVYLITPDFRFSTQVLEMRRESQLRRDHLD